jgi:chaperonin GroES
VKRTSLS